MTGPHPLPQHQQHHPNQLQQPHQRPEFQPEHTGEFGQPPAPYSPNDAAHQTGGFQVPPSFPVSPVPGSAPGTAAAYPGPVLEYPKRRRTWPVTAAIAALAALAGVVFVGVRQDAAPKPGVITSASAQRAIQGYLDALGNKDIQAISRNALCGLYDGVRDRRSDDALAKMASDAFQQQFSRTQVTSVDTIVFQSNTSAQVLFTMQTVPARGTPDGPAERQGVAQLLSRDNSILVCSYVLRPSGMY